LNHFRNLLIFQVSRGDLNMIEVSEAEVAALKEQSALANTESLTRILEVLTDFEMRFRDAASKKILLEVALLKSIEVRSATSLDSVLKQLNQLRGGGGANVSPAPVMHAQPAQKIQPVAAAAKPIALAETAPVSADLASLWTQLIEAVGRVSPFTRSYLVDANPISFEKNILVIGFDPEFEDHLGLVDNARNHTLLQTKLAELGHANCQIKFIKAEAPVGVPQITKNVSREEREVSEEKKSTQASPPSRPSRDISSAKEKGASIPFNKDTFKNDPLIQKALEIFKGQIVEVRS